MVIPERHPRRRAVELMGSFPHATRAEHASAPLPLLEDEDEDCRLSTVEFFGRLEAASLDAEEERALRLDPNSATAYNNMCSSHNKLKQWDLAEAACRKSLELDPDSELAKNNLAWAESGKRGEL